MNEDQIKLTYETLFEILRLEKNKGELQQLDKTFFKDFTEYLAEKSEMMRNENDQSKLFGEQENLKTLNELTNIKKIIKELYEKRERKIIDLVINKSRTNSNLVTNTNLLPEEMTLYDALLKVLNENRVNILHSALDINKITLQKAQSNTNKELKIVKFKQDVNKFVDKELKPYGPFKINDIAPIPQEIAQILIQKDKVEEVKIQE